MLKCFVVLLKCLLNEWSYKLIVILNVGSVVMMILFKPMNNVVSFVLELFFANRIVNKKAFTFILSERLLRYSVTRFGEISHVRQNFSTLW